MNDFLYLILGGLATFRLSLLLSKEDGPAYIFRTIRNLPPPKTSARDGLACPWCVSIWFAAAVALFYWRVGIISGIDWPVYWLALSALAIIINQTWTKG